LISAWSIKVTGAAWAVWNHRPRVQAHRIKIAIFVYSSQRGGLEFPEFRVRQARYDGIAGQGLHINRHGRGTPNFSETGHSRSMLLFLLASSTFDAAVRPTAQNPCPD